MWPLKGETGDVLTRQRQAAPAVARLIVLDMPVSVRSWRSSCSSLQLQLYYYPSLTLQQEPLGGSGHLATPSATFPDRSASKNPAAEKNEGDIYIGISTGLMLTREWNVSGFLVVLERNGNKVGLVSISPHVPTLGRVFKSVSV